MDPSLFDYPLPPERIAQTPVEPRDASRLLVLYRSSGRVEHRRFSDIGEYTRPGDVLVLNDSRVMAARLFARRRPQGGRVELLLLHPSDAAGDQAFPHRWEVLVRPGRRAPPGQVLEVGQGQLEVRVLARTECGGRLVEFASPTGEPVRALLQRYGSVPLPPYIRQPLADPDRYQTVYAGPEGSAAAPTAGLHFTRELLERLESQGVRLARLTLHVGVGTFRPVRSPTVEGHRMHAEYFTIPESTAAAIEQARRQGARIWAVGTTVVRALESASGPDGAVHAGSGWTRLFIYPGYRFRVVEVLVTNFHLPRSTLLMLVCAFAGTGRVLEAYRTAAALGYRFYSFGDAMLVLP